MKYNKRANLLSIFINCKLALHFVVKVVGIEPTSESTFTRVSPSAAFVLFISLLETPKSRLDLPLSYCSPMLLGAHTEFSFIFDALTKT